MRRSILVLAVAASCFSQGRENRATNVIRDDSAIKWIPPAATFASPPSSPATGLVYVFTDASSVGVCSGGESALATCRYSGSVWQATGGGGNPTNGTNGQG